MFSQDQLLKSYKSSIDLVEDEMVKRYGQRYLEYRKNYKLAGDFEYDSPFPLYLMLEQTYSCNLKCPTCIHGFPDRKKDFNPDIKVMHRSTFERVVDEGKKHNCPSIAFHVNDEPLIIPDLACRVDYAKKHGFMDLFITTNGTFLTLELAKDLIKAGVTRILFSIDAATAETYGKVRPGGFFESVVENLEALVEYKKANRMILPAIRVSFVVNKLNIHERELFATKFSPLSDYIEFQGFSSYYDANKDLIPPGSKQIEGFKCNEPWRKLIIRANGDVLPCCSFYGYEIVVGNINETSLKHIFNSERVRILKNEFKEGIYNLPACKACSTSFYTQ